MSNYTIKTGNENISNVKELALILTLRYNSVYHPAQDACANFFLSAALLPAGEFLGWQLSFDKEVRASHFAFSSAGTEVTAKDFNWLFKDCSLVEPEPTKSFGDFGGEGRWLYALVDRPESGATNQSWIDEENLSKVTDSSEELFKMMAESGAVMRIIAESKGKGTLAHGEMLFSFPEKISLRMRSALSLAFPDTIVKELDEKRDADGQLRLGYAAVCLGGLLQGLQNKSHDALCETDDYDLEADFLEEEDDSLCEDFDDDCFLGVDIEGSCYDDDEAGDAGEDDGDSGFEDADALEDMSIDELELPVRAYNCLRRAGVSTVGELCKMTDEELTKVRNLGKKSIEDIKKKLSGLPLTPVAACLIPPDYSAMLEELIGLSDVKEQVRKIKALARMKCDLKKRGVTSVPVVLNMEFVGNPGTAKTTVARILAGIFHEIGLLPGNEIVEVGRSDLVGKYVGHTADKVKSIFQNARGKVLFIDEAYSLVEAWEGSFGDEAINTIVQEMENHREDTIVIFAGYPDKMEKLFSRNPGLKSRVPFKISFQDYSADEMVEIAEREARRRGFEIEPQARESVRKICGEAAKRSEEGNGRFCRNLVENAVLGYALRVYGNDGEAGDEAFSLAASDFTLPEVVQNTKKGVSIGFRA